MRPQGHPEPPARGHEPHMRELCTSVKSCRVSHTRVASPVEGSRSKWIDPFWALWERTLPGDPERTRRPPPGPRAQLQERGAGGDGEQLQSHIHTACPRSTAKSRARHGQAIPPLACHVPQPDSDSPAGQVQAAPGCLPATWEHLRRELAPGPGGPCTPPEAAGSGTGCPSPAVPRHVSHAPYRHTSLYLMTSLLGLLDFLAVSTCTGATSGTGSSTAVSSLPRRAAC